MRCRTSSCSNFHVICMQSLNATCLLGPYFLRRPKGFPRKIRIQVEEGKCTVFSLTVSCRLISCSPIDSHFSVLVPLNYVLNILLSRIMSSSSFVEFFNQGYCSVIQHLPCMYKTLGFIFSTTKKNLNQVNKSSNGFYGNS